MSYRPYFIFYVNDPQASAAYYEKMLQQPPLESSPGFALFKLNDGAMLGFWKRQDVLPVVGQPGDCAQSEVCLPLPNRAAVDTVFSEWLQLGAMVIQEPTKMDFGYTCCSQDADGNRLRLFCREE